MYNFSTKFYFKHGNYCIFQYRDLPFLRIFFASCWNITFLQCVTETDRQLKTTMMNHKDLRPFFSCYIFFITLCSMSCSVWRGLERRSMGQWMQQVHLWFDGLWPGLTADPLSCVSKPMKRQFAHVLSSAAETDMKCRSCGSVAVRHRVAALSGRLSTNEF